MKQILLLMLTIFATLLASSQIQQKANVIYTHVGEINRTHTVGAVPEVALDMSIQPGTDSSHTLDTLYVIRFDDMTYQSPIFSRTESRRYDLHFHNTGGTITQLYDILLNVFTDKRYAVKDYATVITLGTKTVTIRRDFYADKPRIQVVMDDGMFTIRNTKELNRLFGKPAK